MATCKRLEKSWSGAIPSRRTWLTIAELAQAGDVAERTGRARRWVETDTAGTEITCWTGNDVLRRIVDGYRQALEARRAW